MEDVSGKSRKPNPADARKYPYHFPILRGEEEFLLNFDGFIVSSNLEEVNVTGYDRL
jgi:hypothetical protein